MFAELRKKLDTDLSYCEQVPLFAGLVRFELYLIGFIFLGFIVARLFGVPAAEFLHPTPYYDRWSVLGLFVYSGAVLVPTVLLFIYRPSVFLGRLVSKIEGSITIGLAASVISFFFLVPILAYVEGTVEAHMSQVLGEAVSAASKTKLLLVALYVVSFPYEILSNNQLLPSNAFYIWFFVLAILGLFVVAKTTPGRFWQRVYAYYLLKLGSFFLVFVVLMRAGFGIEDMQVSERENGESVISSGGQVIATMARDLDALRARNCEEVTSLLGEVPLVLRYTPSSVMFATSNDKGYLIWMKGSCS